MTKLLPLLVTAVVLVGCSNKDAKIASQKSELDVLAKRDRQNHEQMKLLEEDADKSEAKLNELQKNYVNLEGQLRVSLIRIEELEKQIKIYQIQLQN